MREVFSEFVDYAGLFPPATCTMADAVRNYASYRESPDRRMLGRFVVAASRLLEFGTALADDPPRVSPGKPWRLSVVLGALIPDEIRRISEYNHTWGHLDAVVDSVECKVTTAGQALALGEQIPGEYLRHYEVPREGPYQELIAAIAQAGAFAKVRTGGTTPDLFPAAAELTQFLLCAVTRGVPFKATAGLHHPYAGEYPLTYAKDAPRHRMYGFVNLLLATTEIARGGEGATAQAILEDAGASNFTHDSEGFRWGTRRYSIAELVDTRTRFFLGFGSCSFREPVDELQLKSDA